ncbi:hypothetical protein O9G_006168, partial [Rozella allomycis CSF55]
MEKSNINAQYTILTKDNYHFWEKCARAELTSKGYWEITSSRIERARMTKEQAELDGKAFGHLLRIVERSVLLEYQDKLGSANELWEAIKEDYDRTDSEYYSSLIEKLDKIKLTEDGDGEKFLSELRSVFEKIAATGMPMTEAQKFHHVIAKLPRRKYLPFLMSLRTVPEISKTFRLACQHLRSIWSISETDGKDESVLFAKGNNKGGGASQGRGKGKSKKHIECYNCGKRGHYQNECRSRGGKANTAREVPHGGPGKGPGRGYSDLLLMTTSRELEYKEEESTAQKLPGEVPSEVPVNGGFDRLLVNQSEDRTSLSEAWILDGGATNHMSGNKEIFETLEIIKPIRIEVANGQSLKATHRGIVRLRARVEGQVVGRSLGGVLYVPGCQFNIVSETKLLGKEGVKINK